MYESNDHQTENHSSDAPYLAVVSRTDETDMNMTFIYSLSRDFSGMNNQKFAEWQECCFPSREEAIEAGFAENPGAKRVYTAQVLSTSVGSMLRMDDVRGIAINLIEMAAKFRPLRFDSPEAGAMFDQANLSYLTSEDVISDLFEHIAEWFSYSDRIFWADHICSHENPCRRSWWQRLMW
jgi:hypothetical protein